MKSCPYCGQTFKDHVDFCFDDGEVLVAVAGASESEALDAPAPPQRAQQSQVTATPSSRTKRRRLVGGRGQMPADPSDDPLAKRNDSVPTAEGEPEEGESTEASDDAVVASDEAGGVPQVEDAGTSEGESTVPKVDPTAETPLPAPASQRPAKSFVSEDDTIPIPIPPSKQRPANSGDPTVPPAPERSGTPVPASAPQGAQSETPIVPPGSRGPSSGPSESASTAGGGAAAAGASGGFREAPNQVGPSTYAAAPAPVEQGQADDNRMLMYGGAALAAAVLLLGSVGVGMFALGVLGSDSGSTDTVQVDGDPVAPKPSKSQKTAKVQPEPAAPDALPEAPDPTPPGPDVAPKEPGPAPEPAAPTPVAPMPVAPAPVAPAPVAPAPVEPAPVAPAPVEPAVAPSPAPEPPAPTNDGAVDAGTESKRGKVSFITDPPGKLYLLGEAVGEADGVELTLDYGSYPYEVRLAGHAPLTGTLVVDDPDEGTVRGELAEVAVERVNVLVVGVIGMRVLIDDVEDRPPFNTELPVGSQRIKVYNESTKIWERADVKVTGDGQIINLDEIFPHLAAQ